MAEKNNELFMISAIAIVAIVGLITIYLFSMNGSTVTVSQPVAEGGLETSLETTEIAGQAGGTLRVPLTRKTKSVSGTICPAGYKCCPDEKKELTDNQIAENVIATQEDTTLTKEAYPIIDRPTIPTSVKKVSGTSFGLKTAVVEAETITCRDTDGNNKNTFGTAYTTSAVNADTCSNPLTAGAVRTGRETTCLNGQFSTTDFTCTGTDICVEGACRELCDSAHPCTGGRPCKMNEGSYGYCIATPCIDSDNGDYFVPGKATSIVNETKSDVCINPDGSETNIYYGSSGNLREYHCSSAGYVVSTVVSCMCSGGRCKN